MDGSDSTQGMVFTVESDGRKVAVSSVLEARPAFLIGSDPRGHLRLDDAAAAPAHAFIQRQGQEYIIAPRFPQLSLLVNGKRVTAPTRLNPGDTAQIGGSLLRFDQEARLVAPARKPDSVLLVPTPRPKPRVAYTPAPAGMAGLVPAAAGETVIYFPPSAQQTGTNLAAMTLGMVTVLGIVLALAFSLFNVGAAGGTAPMLSGYAYNDGNVTVLMFDADW